MSEQATETATPESVTSTVTADPPAAPDAQPAVTTVVEPKPAEPDRPLSRREAREAMQKDRQAAREKEAAETAKAATEKEARRDPKTGKFLPAEGGESEEEEVADGGDAVGEQDTKPEPADEQVTVQDDDADEAAAKDKAGEGIRVEIAKDHPISEMGLDAFTASTPLEAQGIQALLNGTYSRRREVEDLTGQLSTVTERYKEAQQRLVELESNQSASEKWKASPEYQAKVDQYQQIKEDIGPEAAKDYWRGVQADYQTLVESERTERAGAIEAQEAADAGEAWKREAWQRIGEKLPEHLREIPGFRNWFEEEVQFLNDRLEAGRLPSVTNADEMHAELVRLVSARLAREPSVQAVYAERRDAEKAEKTAKAKKDEEARRTIEKDKRKAVDDFKKTAADTRKAVPPHPLAGVPGSGSATQADAEADAAPKLSEMNTYDLKRNLRQQARQDTRRHLGR
jgi:hypothetical protein